MSDTLRQGSDQSSPSAVNEATFLGGILRKGELVGGWEITSKIAVTSGEAELYLATKDGIVGVVKYYRNPGFQPKDEVLTTLSSWKHEDVINLLGSGRYNGLFFEAMEYAAGGALNSQNEDGCFKYLPLSEENTLHMIKEVTNAFHACHEAGIIHRDIKPANIFYRNADGTDFVIGDFGISSQLDTAAQLSSRMTQNINRTEGYAGPEIYSGVITKAVDYYALGITVWEVLTGKSAFEGRNQSLISRDTIEGRIIDDLLGRSESATLGEHIKTLIKGLLTHRHDKRWGYEQIQEWFGGNDVPVYNQRPEIQVPVYKFDGRELVKLNDVSKALLENPTVGRKHLFRGLLEKWLATFDQDLAMKVGDIREGLGEAAGDKALRRAALILNPGQPFLTANGKAIGSLFDFKRLIETEPEELVDHLRNPEDGLWDYFEMWGCGPAFEPLKQMLGMIKSQKRLVNMVVVALNGNIINPFRGTRFKDTELSSLSQLSTFPTECQKRFMLELEDANGILAIWLETMSGLPYPKEWSKNGLPEWNAVLGYWKCKVNEKGYQTAYTVLSTKTPAAADVINMILVKGGSFKMTDIDFSDKSSEIPVMKVTLSDFYICKYVVTFDEYDGFCKARGKGKTKDNHWGRGLRPVINVSWNDAVEYCNWRSEKEGLEIAYANSTESISCNWKATGYRLPTEAQWEYAARGGVLSEGFEYSGSDDVNEVAWYVKNAEGKTHPVGEKRPNELGLYDMSGNVFEWCWDRYDDYPAKKQTDPKGGASGLKRVLRGGSWAADASSSRAGYRDYYGPLGSNDSLGFRLSRRYSPI